jgi:hypothetical protein
VNDPDKEKLDIHFEIDPDNGRNAAQSFSQASACPTDRQEQDWTLRAYTATLHSLGVQEAERTKILQDWSRASGANIPDMKLRDVSDRLSLSTDANFCLGKDNWDRLVRNLGVSAENPYEFERSGQSIAQGVWKSAFRAVEKERQKAEARGKMEKMKEAKKRERKEHRQQQGKYQEEERDER